MENLHSVYPSLPAGNWMKFFSVERFLAEEGQPFIEGVVPHFQCTNGTLLVRFEDLERCISPKVFEKMQFHVTTITIEDPAKNKKAFIRIG